MRKTLTREIELFVKAVTKKEKNNDNSLIQNRQPKNGNVNNNNNRTLLVGPSFLGKTYPMLKIIARIASRDIYIIANSPPE